MSSLTSLPARGRASPRPAVALTLRCPGEHAALAVCIVTNAVVIAACFAIIYAGTAWLDTHEFIAKHLGWIRSVALAALLAAPVTTIGRHLDVHAARTRGVRVGEEQFRELHQALLRACRKLGVERVPELYIRHGVKVPAAAYSVHGGRSVVVLSADLMTERWKDGLDWLTFQMAGAVGSIVLGHTRWWVELLTVYTRRIPGLRTPLLMKWAYSRDRCAAFVVPDGIRGLLVEAVGKNAVSSVEVGPFITQAKRERGFWDLVAAILRAHPPLTFRVRALYEAGFFDRTRDFERGRS